MPDVRLLNFAVLDGQKPAQWRPWGTNGRSFGAMSAGCDTMVLPPTGTPLADIWQAKLFPNLVAFEEVLEEPHGHIYVGAIIDGVRDPANLAYFSQKYDDIDRLCLAIGSKAKGLVPLSKIVGFEIWIVIDPASRTALDKWGASLRALARDRLKTGVRVRYLRRDDFFEEFVDDYLTEAVDRLSQGVGIF